MIDVNNCDLITLFMFRYALDKPHDTLDLERDITDLQSFPERLDNSYFAEWKSYVKRELYYKMRAHEQEKRALIALIRALEKGEHPAYNRLCEIIKTAVKVNNSPDVAVMTTSLKSFVNQLLKL